MNNNVFLITWQFMRKLNLSKSELECISVIYGYTKIKKSFHGSQELLAELTSNHRVTVQDALKSLEEKNLIIKEVTKPRQPCKYTANLDSIAKILIDINDYSVDAKEHEYLYKAITSSARLLEPNIIDETSSVGLHQNTNTSSPTLLVTSSVGLHYNISNNSIENKDNIKKREERKNFSDEKVSPKDFDNPFKESYDISEDYLVELLEKYIHLNGVDVVNKITSICDYVIRKKLVIKSTFRQYLEAGLEELSSIGPDDPVKLSVEELRISARLLHKTFTVPKVNKVFQLMEEEED